jgi:hypothetical protein
MASWLSSTRSRPQNEDKKSYSFESKETRNEVDRTIRRFVTTGEAKGRTRRVKYFSQNKAAGNSISAYIYWLIDGTQRSRQHLLQLESAVDLGAAMAQFASQQGIHPGSPRLLQRRIRAQQLHSLLPSRA